MEINLLNRVGRVMLAQSILSSMPIYTIQNIWVPEGVCNKINSTLFVTSYGEAIMLIGWTGIPSFCLKLMGVLIFVLCVTWILPFLRNINGTSFMSKQKLWVQILESKYLCQGTSLSASTTKGASYIWNSIVRAMNRLALGFQFCLRKGETTLWYDKWLVDDYLCRLMPFVFTYDTYMHVRDI